MKYFQHFDMIRITNENSMILKENSAWSKFTGSAYLLLFPAIFELPLHFQIRPHGATSATCFLCLLSEIKKIDIKLLVFRVKPEILKILRETTCDVVGSKGNSNTMDKF